MIVKKLEIQEIKLLRFDPKLNSLKVKVSFVGDEGPIIFEFKFGDDLDRISKGIIRYVKEVKKPRVGEGEHILDGVAIIDIINDEEVITGVYKGLIKIDQKIEEMKRTNIASEYMRLFETVNAMKIVLYRKEGNLVI